MAGTPFHTGVSLRGFHFEDFSLGWLLEDTIDIDDIGKAVSIDESAANTVKLAADGDFIFGRLASFEDRTIEGIKIGAVERRFCNTLPIKSGETVAVGDTVVGAGAGEVKAMTDPTSAGGKVYLPFSIPATELAAGTAIELVSPVAGFISRIRTNVQTDIVTGGALSVEVATVAVGGLAVTVADAAPKGTIQTDTPTTAKSATTIVAAGDRITITPAAGFNGGGALTGVLEIDLATTPSHFHNVVAEIVGTDAIVVQI